MPYTATSLSALAVELAVALGDISNVFFTDDELRRYLRESLRTWNCYTTYWRDRRQFQTSQNVQFYDLRNPITPALTPILTVPGDIGPITNDLQYALMEPFVDFSGGYTSIYTTTLMYTSAEIDRAILQAIAQWNFDTGVIVQVEPSLPVPAPPAFKVELPETVCDVRHAQILGIEDGFPTYRFSLRRQDEFDSTTFGTPFSLLTSNTPYAYSFLLANTQPSLRLIPPPKDTGTVELISVRSTNLPPQDWIWAIKWLALYFLLTQDGQCRDYYRAAYCKKRYDDALLLARIHPSVLQAYVNAVPIAAPTAPSDADCFMVGWQNRIGIPADYLMFGWNLLALTPVPDQRPFSITLELNISAPTDTAPLQLAQEHKQLILDYAKHLACFKMGGAEFGSTLSHYENFFLGAMGYNSKLRIEAKNFNVMRDRAARDKEQVYQRRLDPVDATTTVPTKGG